MLVHCMDMSHFVYLFISWLTFGLFLFGAIVNNTAVFIYKFLHEYVFLIFSGVYGEMELLDHMVTLCLMVWSTAKLFSKEAAPF
jgi:hypothetical protein